MDYADAGVNIELGDDASEILYNAAKLTWDYRNGKIGEVVCPFDDFAGIRVVNIGELPKGSVMSFGFDGIGTKVELAERTGKHDTVAYDLFAMVCDDAVVRGGEPALVGSILDVRSLGTDDESYIDCVKQLAKGYIEAAKEANVAVINGEIAELGYRVQGRGNFNYNWGAGCVWFAHKDRMLTGKEIEIGDSLIALREDGPRSNGLSLIRKILESRYGPDWDKAAEGEGYALDILHPSRIYSKAVVKTLGGFDDKPKEFVHGIAHITGGGLPGKLARMLKPSGLGAYIHNPYVPPELFKKMQELGNVPDEEAYKTWNMGQGMVIATSNEYAITKIAGEHNISCIKIGAVSDKLGITIKSRGLFSEGKELFFD